VAGDTVSALTTDANPLQQRAYRGLAVARDTDAPAPHGVDERVVEVEQPAGLRGNHLRDEDPPA